VPDGQLIGTPAGTAANAYTKVRVPTVYAAGNAEVQCYSFRPSQPASCAPPVPASAAPVTALTYSGRYPPLYYLLVGGAGLITKSVTGVYLMRLVGALLSAIMLGLAVFSARRWSDRRLLPIAVMIAATPMTVYLSAVVNPNGLEITSAVCLWVSSLVLFTERRHDPPAGLVAIAAVSAAVLTSMRGLSPLWTALIVLLVISVTSWRALWKMLLTSRSFQVAAGALLVIGILDAGWIIHEHALDLIPAGAQVHKGASALHVLWMSIKSATVWPSQAVGVFGTLDTHAPHWALDIWYVVFVMALVAGFYFARRRARVVLVMLAVTLVVLPVVVQFSQATRVGLVWQGRYLLPLAAGVPVIAASAAGPSPRLVRSFRLVAPPVVLALGVALFGSLFQTVRRYTVGVKGSFNLDGGWQPPGGSWAIVLGGAVACVGVSAAILMAGFPPPHRRDPVKLVSTASSDAVSGQMKSTQALEAASDQT
jgi:hypothetical protein